MELNVNIQTADAINVVNQFIPDLKRVMQETIKVLKLQDNVNVSVNFINTQKSRELNYTYRHKNYIADVLSFPTQADSEFEHVLLIHDLGDIFICFQKARLQAKKLDHSLKREICFLFLHGLLHLNGYDHQTEAEASIMFGLQKQILTHLNILRTSNFIQRRNSNERNIA